MGLFLPFFVLLFVWVITFAILQKTKIIGEARGLHAIVALGVSLMVVAMPDITRLIAVIVPAFFFLFLFFMLVAMGVLFVKGGTDTADLYKALGGQGITWLFVVIGLIVLAFAAGEIWGDALLPLTQGDTPTTNATGNLTSDSGSFRDNLGATLFHPSIVGMAAFMIIATLAILFLGAEQKPLG